MIQLEDIKKALREKGKYWIAFTGDSITSCEWVHPNWREMVEYVLKSEVAKLLPADDEALSSWGMRFFNFAYDGANSQDILEKVADINKVQPDLVIGLIGANDPFTDVSVEEHKENILKIKNELESAGSKFVFGTCNNPWNETASSKYRPYIEVDESLKLENFVNLFEASNSFPKDRIYTFISEADIPLEGIKKGELDYWHPNQLGNAYIAKVILKEVFGVEIDPEKYIQTTLSGEKLPSY